MSATPGLAGLAEAADEPDAETLFANLVERAVCAFADLMLVGILMGFVTGPLGTDLVSRLIGATLPWLYFAASWASPLRATPAQFLIGLRVVDVRARTLSPWRAALRGLLFIAIFLACFALLGTPSRPWLGAVSLVAYALVLLAAVTTHRQAAHDLLTGSIVVKAKALRQPHALAHLEESADAGRGSAWPGRPPISQMVQAVMLIGGTAFMLYSYVQIAYDRELYARTSYAIGQAGTLRQPIADFYLEHRRLPWDAAELGVDSRTNYPDGGYYELESSGTIRIRFSKIPELIRGSIVIRPRIAGEDIEWQCRGDGGFERAHLPSMCRD